MATLVAYFSAEGRTAKVARALSKLTKAELFEVKPEVPYSASDINWKNPLARCNKEKIGKKDVPLAEKLLPFMKNATIAGEKLVKAADGVDGLKEWVKSLDL